MTKPNIPKENWKPVGEVLSRIAARLAAQKNSSGTVQRYADRAVDPIAAGDDDRTAAALGCVGRGCSGNENWDARGCARQAATIYDRPHAPEIVAADHVATARAPTCAQLVT